MVKLRLKKKKKRKKKRKSEILPRFEEFANELDQRGKKLDIAVDIIERSMGQDEFEENKFCAVPDDKQQDLFFRLLCLMENLNSEDEDALSDGEFSNESMN